MHRSTPRLIFPLAALALSACLMPESTSTSASSGPAAGRPTALFAPEGCAFTIAERPEYEDWQPSALVVGTTPNIRRVRLGLGGNVRGTVGRADPATSIGVAWQTDEGTLVSRIAWGTSSDPSTWPAANVRSGVTWDTPSEAPVAGEGAERMHEAYVCGLTPATTYYYRVGGGPSGAETWGPVFRVTTTPAAGSTPVTIAIAGDAHGENSGGHAPSGVNTWQLLERKLYALAPTLSLFAGDMVNDAADQGQWEQWLDKAERDVDGSVLTLPTLLTLEAHGDHEDHAGLFYGNVVLPQDNASYPAYGELFYSFDAGPVHVVVVDNMYVTDGGDDAYQPVLSQWLDEDLATADANRSTVPWIITLHHYPDYDSSLHSADADVATGRAFFAPIWQRYHVDMAFSGHDHDYERTYPLLISSDLAGDVDNPTITNDAMGTTFVTCGGAGADPYGADISGFTATSASFTTGALGVYAMLTATGTTLTLTAHYLEEDGSDPVIDTYAIHR